MSFSSDEMVSKAFKSDFQKAAIAESISTALHFIVLVESVTCMLRNDSMVCSNSTLMISMPCSWETLPPHNVFWSLLKYISAQNVFTASGVDMLGLSLWGKTRESYLIYSLIAGSMRRYRIVVFLIDIQSSDSVHVSALDEYTTYVYRNSLLVLSGCPSNFKYNVHFISLYPSAMHVTLKSPNPSRFLARFLSSSSICIQECSSHPHNDIGRMTWNVTMTPSASPVWDFLAVCSDCLWQYILCCADNKNTSLECRSCSSCESCTCFKTSSTSDNASWYILRPSRAFALLKSAFTFVLSRKRAALQSSSALL